MIQVTWPKYRCECCDREVRAVNVVNNKNLCHDCTIIALRVMDNSPMSHPRLGIPVKPDGSVYLPQSGTHKAHWTFGCDNGRGYLRVRIAGKRYFVHRLVLETFVGPAPKDKPECDHLNRNTQDNRVENLRWVSRVQNCRNTLKQDRVELRGLPHTFEDRQAYSHGSCQAYYRGHRETILEKKKEYRKAMKLVVFADGSAHWLPKPCANELIKIPKKFRLFK